MYVTRFELATFWSVARRSIQLSYARISVSLKRKCYITEEKGKCQASILNFLYLMFTGSFICQRYAGHYVVESTPGFPSKDDERDAVLRRAGAAACGARLVDEVLQGVAVHDFVDGVVDFLIKGEGRAAG